MPRKIIESPLYICVNKFENFMFIVTAIGQILNSDSF